MNTIQDNLQIICENLAEDLATEFDKDKAMILNNLCEYILPKKQRVGFQTEIGEFRDFKITYHYESTDKEKEDQGV